MPKSKHRAGRSRTFRARIAQGVEESRASAHNRSIPQCQPGARNAYQCKACAGYTVTVHADAGTTPMFLDCRASADCPGMMVSGMYAPVPPELGEPTYEWYAPDRAELSRLPREQADHVNRGGLLLRAIEESENTDASRS